MAKLPALPFVRSSVSEGLSANQSYKRYQTLAHEGGLQGMRRQDYLRLYSQTRALRSILPLALDAPKDVLPSGPLIKQRDTVRTSGFGHWVTIVQRQRGGSEEFVSHYLVGRNQEMTPGEAELEAQRILNTNPDEYDRTTLAIFYAGTERFNPRGS